MTVSAINVLFVSLRNTVRSTLAQACLNKFGHRRFRAFSCGAPRHLGTSPAPATARALTKAGIPLEQQICQDWSAFTRMGAPRMDFVITLAEDLAGLSPAWPGQPVTAMWPFADALRPGESQEVEDHAMWVTLLALRRRSELLASLPMHSVEKSALRDDIRDMARMH